MSDADHDHKALVSRISMSLPEELLIDLDKVVTERGFASRSQAIALMVNRYIAEHKREFGDEVMVGTITLLYDNSVPGLQKLLADLQVRYIDEVINSLHVHLMHEKTLEVILVQGPARQLQAIADEMTRLRGVIYGMLQTVAALIPQVHPFVK